MNADYFVTVDNYSILAIEDVGPLANRLPDIYDQGVLYKGTCLTDAQRAAPDARVIPIQPAGLELCLE